MTWFTHLWRREAAALPEFSLAEQAATVVEALDERFSHLKAAIEPLAETGQRSIRSLAKLGLRLDELERKLEGGFAAQASAARPAAPKPFEGLTDLLDAMDLLDAAAASLGDDESARAVRQGLSGVLARLDRAVRAAGAQRCSTVDVAPDPRLFRVVGTIEQSTGESGLVVRVTRAAATTGAHVLREGEVLTRVRSEA